MKYLHFGLEVLTKGINIHDLLSKTIYCYHGCTYKTAVPGSNQKRLHREYYPACVSVFPFPFLFVH